MTIKCIRCGNIEKSAAKYVGVWDIKYGVNGTLYDNEHFLVGLCPDCQLPERGKSGGIKTDNLVYTIDMFHQHEKDILDIGARLLNVEEEISEKAYTNLLGCLTTIEKRTAKLEREMDRVWEVMRCMGEK